MHCVAFEGDHLARDDHPRRLIRDLERHLAGIQIQGLVALLVMMRRQRMIDTEHACARFGRVAQIRIDPNGIGRIGKPLGNFGDVVEGELGMVDPDESRG